MYVGTLLRVRLISHEVFNSTSIVRAGLHSPSEGLYHLHVVTLTASCSAKITFLLKLYNLILLELNVWYFCNYHRKPQTSLILLGHLLNVI